MNGTRWAIFGATAFVTLTGFNAYLQGSTARENSAFMAHQRKVMEAPNDGREYYPEGTPEREYGPYAARIRLHEKEGQGRI